MENPKSFATSGSRRQRFRYLPLLPVVLLPALWGQPSLAQISVPLDPTTTIALNTGSGIAISTLGSGSQQGSAASQPIQVASAGQVQSAPSAPTGAVPAVASVPAGTVKVAAAGASDLPVDASKTSQRYSDPLADLASVALSALSSRPVGGTVTAAAATSGGAGASIPNSVPVQTSSQATTVVADTAPLSSSPNSGVTSMVINTADISAYISGTIIAAPSAPATQTLVATFSKDPEKRYIQAIHQVAAATSAQIKGSKAGDFENVWLATDTRRMTAVLTALAQVGTQYRFTGNEPGGFDCSGLTSYSWAMAGVKIPRTSGDQIAAATLKKEADLNPGDLLWRPGHIGMYLGVGDYMVHSPQTGKSVEVKSWGKMAKFGSPI